MVAHAVSSGEIVLVTGRGDAGWTEAGVAAGDGVGAAPGAQDVRISNKIATRVIKLYALLFMFTP